MVVGGDWASQDTGKLSGPAHVDKSHFRTTSGSMAMARNGTRPERQMAPSPSKHRFQGVTPSRWDDNTSLAPRTAFLACGRSGDERSFREDR